MCLLRNSPLNVSKYNDILDVNSGVMSILK